MHPLKAVSEIHLEMFMSLTSLYDRKTSEQQLLVIVRRLPPERVAELIDFARFVEFRTEENNCE